MTRYRKKKTTPKPSLRLYLSNNHKPELRTASALRHQVISSFSWPGQMFTASWNGKEIPGTFSKFLRRTRYLFHNESRSLCFLLGHLLHLHSLCELLAKGQVSLQGTKQAKFTLLTAHSSAAVNHTAPVGWGWRARSP